MIRRALIASTCLCLAACVPPRKPAQPPQQPAAAEEAELRALPPSEWPVLSDDLPLQSLERAAANSAAYLRAQGDRLLKVGDRSVGTQLLVETLEALVEARRQAADGADLKRRLAECCELFAVSLGTAPAPVHYSSYYQPTLPARRRREGEFKYPLYRKPPDLLVVPLGPFNPKWKGESIVGRLDKNGNLVPYFSRRDIDVRGELEGKGLEVAWLSSAFDRLDLHVQGSGILVFPDGREMLAKYAATNDRPYHSVGLSVVGAGAMTREEINHERLRQYLAEHPEGEAWLISRNPRYTFFDLTELPPDGEPFGTIDRPLTAGRSIAVDPRYVPLGTAAWADFPLPQADAKGRLLAKAPARRFVLPQDTGGAIKGPARVDFYVGHGPDAKAMATNVWDKGRLYILLKKLPPRTR